mmetsp:Transcript_89981/g.291207  ORF Transcript_89981/g.291207 Transcript_89981/m.291207 type:complete len:216 (-) Transcript_89981:157-804(-)
MTLPCGFQGKRQVPLLLLLALLECGQSVQWAAQGKARSREDVIASCVRDARVKPPAGLDLQGMCAVVANFTALWDSWDPASMQNAVNMYCKPGTEVEWAMTNNLYYSMYSSNVEKRMKQFGRKLRLAVRSDFVPVDLQPNRVVMERNNSALSLHMGRSRFQRVLRKSPKGYPSNLTRFSSDCDGCQAMMKLVLEPESASDSRKWVITELAVIRQS